MFVSLVIPVKNGEWCLPHCLEALDEQDRKPDEILICIGKCSDKTEQVVLNYQYKSSVPVVVLYDREGIGTGYAMKILTENAKGDVILWIDADHIKPKDWVRQIVSYYEKDPDLVYLRERGEENSGDVISYFKPPKTEYVPSIKYDDGKFISPAGMMSFKREKALEVGNFDPYFARGQDLDMTVRMTWAGFKGGETTPYGHHFGVNGKMNIWKPFKTPTFVRFLYKYGWKYGLIDKYGLFAFLNRYLLCFSILLFFLELFLQDGIYLTLSMVGIIIFISAFLIGFKSQGRKMTLNVLLVQVLSSIGGVYQLYSILTDKNKPPFLYGKKLIPK